MKLIDQAIQKSSCLNRKYELVFKVQRRRLSVTFSVQRYTYSCQVISARGQTKTTQTDITKKQ